MIATSGAMMMGESGRFGNRPIESGRLRPVPPGGEPIQAVFVYGTLQRGQCRESLWPAVPLRVDSAWTCGALFTRPDYPAMTAGTDRVLGEWWQFDLAAMPRVIAALDEIEGTNQPGQPDLYRRRALEVYGLDGKPLGTAYGYLYAADPVGDGFCRLRPADAGGFLQWSVGDSP